MSTTATITAPASGILVNKLDDNAITAAVAYTDHQARLEDQRRRARQQRLQRLQYIPPLPRPAIEPVPFTPLKARNSIKSPVSSIRSFGKEKPKKLCSRFWEGMKKRVASIATASSQHFDPKRTRPSRPSRPAPPLYHNAATCNMAAHDVATLESPKPPPPLLRPKIALAASPIATAFELAALPTPELQELGPPPAWELDAVTTERVLDVTATLMPATPSPHDTLVESLEGDRKVMSNISSSSEKDYPPSGEVAVPASESRKASISTLNHSSTGSSPPHVKHATHLTTIRASSSSPALNRGLPIPLVFNSNGPCTESIGPRKQEAKQDLAKLLQTTKSSFEPGAPTQITMGPREQQPITKHMNKCTAEEQKINDDMAPPHIHIPISRYHPAIHFHEVPEYSQEPFNAIPPSTRDPIPHLGAGDTIDTLRADTMKEVLATIHQTYHEHKYLGLHPALRPRESCPVIRSEERGRKNSDRANSIPPKPSSKPSSSGLRSLAVAIHLKTKDKNVYRSERKRKEKEERRREEARRQAMNRASTSKLDRELERYRAEVVARRRMQTKIAAEQERASRSVVWT